ncbi:MAG: hypothetical protein PUP91_15890 [Rhizonema sp. PD37]|nr:hypothetical protein [Rhizonema sp. PD37]
MTLADGRKYGLCAVLASQRDAEISDEAIANSSTKVVLPSVSAKARKKQHHQHKTAARKFRSAFLCKNPQRQNADMEMKHEYLSSFTEEV